MRLPGLLAIAGHIGEPGPSPLDIPHVYNIVFLVDTSIYNSFKKSTNKRFFELFIYKNYCTDAINPAMGFAEIDDKRL